VVFLGWKCARGRLLQALSTGERSLQAYLFYVELSEKPNSIVSLKEPPSEWHKTGAR
jgi:hypothetical protein